MDTPAPRIVAFDGVEPKRLGPSPTVHPTAVVRDSQLGAWTEVGARTSVVETTIGDYSYVVHDASIIYATIGRFCSIAAMVRINPGNHPLGRAALHHFTYRSRQFDLGDDDPAFFEWRRNDPVTLGDDVWIGHGAVVLPGVIVGTGAAIGAGAVVTKDVAPFTIVAGSPAKPLRARFPRDVQQALLRIRWWDWSHERLREAMSDFRDLDARTFVAKHDPGFT